MKARRPARKRLFVEELETRVVLSVVGATSTNWSGYAVTTNPGAVTAVSGSWVVPTVTGTGTAYSADWVGIDGASSPTVEQVGTSSDVVNGQPEYYAWYEMYPNYPVDLTGLQVRPGDTISASVTATAPGQFTLQIKDVRNGVTTGSFTTTQSLPGAQQSSAEWVVEAPSSNFGVLPLAAFTPVTFSGASVTLGTTASAVDKSSGQAVQINMASFAGLEDTTSALTDTGSSPATAGFTVTYDAPAAVTPPPFRRHRFDPDTTAPTAPTGATVPAPTAPAPTAPAAAPSPSASATGLPSAASLAAPPVFLPAPTRATVAAPSAVAGSAALTPTLFPSPGAALPGRAPYLASPGDGGGGQAADSGGAAVGDESGAPGNGAVPVPTPDAVPAPVPVPTPTPGDAPEGPEGRAAFWQQVGEALFRARRQEAVSREGGPGWLDRAVPQEPPVQAAAGVALALALGGRWETVTEEAELRRRRLKLHEKRV